MRVLVTGSEGFVGRNLCAVLPNVVCWDAKLDDTIDTLPSKMARVDAVVHLAANADVRYGWDHPERDLSANTMLTAEILGMMKQAGVRRLIFASSSSVYGDAPMPTPETYSGQQTSLYGASKLAGEALIGAYAYAGHIDATIFRFTSMLGAYYRHGLVADFVKHMQEWPHGKVPLQVLGGGDVPRTRMHVLDAVQAIEQALVLFDKSYEVYNVSRPDTITSREVAELVRTQMQWPGEIEAVESSWKGDHPILLDASKLRETGWVPRVSIEASIIDTVDWLTR